MKNFFAYLKRNLSPFFIASLSVLAFTVLVIRICIVNEGFADLINSTLAHYYRRILAAVTDFLPFSLFEVILALIPVILAALVFFTVRAYKASRGLKFLFILLGIISLLYSGYLWGLSMPYHTTAVEEKMELHPGEVTEEQIYSLIVKIADEVNLYSENVDFDSTLKETVMPYSFDDLAEKLEDMVKFLIPKYIEEGKNQLVISIGCTGGKHRSVTLANELHKRLETQRDFGLKIEHRDIGKDALRGK